MIGDKTLSTEELVQRCRRGDQKACKQLYDQFAPQMMGVCMRYARSRAEAQDLLQDGFIKVFSGLKSLKETSTIGAWIHRVMVNNAINYVQREMRRFEDVGEIEDAVEAPAQDYSNLNVEYLLSVIQGLPDKYRMVFNMHEIDGCSFEEIAKQMKIETVSVRSILSRARTMIKEKIEQDER